MFYLSGKVLSFSNILLRRDSKKYFILSKTMVSRVRLFLENGYISCEYELVGTNCAHRYKEYKENIHSDKF